MKRQVKYTLLAPIILFTLTATASDNIERATNGHFYQVVVDHGINWGDANDDATNDNLCGVPGHLATVSTDPENNFINNIREEALANCSGIACAQIWLGGFQQPNSAEPGGGWTWINNEGGFPGVNGGAIYSDWASGEPNDYYGLGGEQYLTMGRYDDAAWNDEKILDQIGGYTVEYESDMNLIINGCDTGIPNKVVDENYCTISTTLYPGIANCKAASSNKHGKYVRCVAKLLKKLVNQGLLPKNSKGKIMRCVAHKK